MKPLAVLAIVAASALPCAASDPAGGRPAIKRKSRPAEVWVAPPPPLYVEPAPLLSGDLVRTILFPDQALVRWGLDYIRGRQFQGRVIGLQVPGVPQPPPPPPPAFGLGVIIRK